MGCRNSQCTQVWFGKFWNIWGMVPQKGAQWGVIPQSLVSKAVQRKALEFSNIQDGGRQRKTGWTWDHNEKLTGSNPLHVDQRLCTWRSPKMHSKETDLSFPAFSMEVEKIRMMEASVMPEEKKNSGIYFWGNISRPCLLNLDGFTQTSVPASQPCLAQMAWYLKPLTRNRHSVEAHLGMAERISHANH